LEKDAVYQHPFSYPGLSPLAGSGKKSHHENDYTRPADDDSTAFIAVEAVEELTPTPNGTKEIGVNKEIHIGKTGWATLRQYRKRRGQ